MRAPSAAWGHAIAVSQPERAARTRQRAIRRRTDMPVQHPSQHWTRKADTRRYEGVDIFELPEKRSARSPPLHLNRSWIYEADGRRCRGVGVIELPENRGVGRHLELEILLCTDGHLRRMGFDEHYVVRTT